MCGHGDGGGSVHVQRLRAWGTDPRAWRATHVDDGQPGVFGCGEQNGSARAVGEEGNQSERRNPMDSRADT